MPLSRKAPPPSAVPGGAGSLDRRPPAEGGLTFRYLYYRLF